MTMNPPPQRARSISTPARSRVPSTSQQPSHDTADTIGDPVPVATTSVSQPAPTSPSKAPRKSPFYRSKRVAVGSLPAHDEVTAPPPAAVAPDTMPPIKIVPDTPRRPSHTQHPSSSSGLGIFKDALATKSPSPTNPLVFLRRRKSSNGGNPRSFLGAPPRNAPPIESSLSAPPAQGGASTSDARARSASSASTSSYTQPSSSNRLSSSTHQSLNSRSTTADPPAHTDRAQLQDNMDARRAQFVFKGPLLSTLSEPSEQAARTGQMASSLNAFGGLDESSRRHHPYSRKEAPYPRNYERHVIDLDVWETYWCRELCKSFTFNVFEKLPTKVLDIGCGTGTWIVESARIWKKTHFVGLDLVPLHPDLKHIGSSDLASRITWVHANFLEGLPFPNEEFDFVYIKRIARGVPEDKWDDLFEEINRVMKPGAAFEMIEDDLFFPGTIKSPEPSINSYSQDDSSDNDESLAEVPMVDLPSGNVDDGSSEPVASNDKASVSKASLSAPTEDSFPTPRAPPSDLNRLKGPPSLSTLSQIHVPLVEKSQSDYPVRPINKFRNLTSPSLPSINDPFPSLPKEKENVFKRFKRRRPSLSTSPPTNGSSVTLNVYSPPSGPSSFMFNSGPVVASVSTTNLPTTNGVSAVISSSTVIPPLPSASSTPPAVAKITPMVLKPGKRKESQASSSRLFPPPPRNPRDHTLLETIYNEMHAQRFINLSPLVMLASTVSTWFVDVRTHAPLTLMFPPPIRRSDATDLSRVASHDEADTKSNTFSDDHGAPSSKPSSAKTVLSADNSAIVKLEDLLRGASRYAVLDNTRAVGLPPLRKLSVSNLLGGDATPTNDSGDQTDGKLASAGDSRSTVTMGSHPMSKWRSLLPNPVVDVDLRTLNLHLAMRVKEILACAEAMWEWVVEQQATIRTRSGSVPSKGASVMSSDDLSSRGEASSMFSGRQDPIKSAIAEMTRSEFDELLIGFELDMRDHMALGPALQDRLGWSMQPGPTPQERKFFDASCEKWAEYQEEQRLDASEQKEPVQRLHHQPTLSGASSSSINGRSSLDHSFVPETRSVDVVDKATIDHPSILPRYLDDGTAAGQQASRYPMRDPAVERPDPSRLSRSFRVFVAWKQTA